MEIASFISKKYFRGNFNFFIFNISKKYFDVKILDNFTANKIFFSLGMICGSARIYLFSLRFCLVTTQEHFLIE